MTKSIYRPADARGVWVFLEHEEGQLEGVSLELLSQGRELADALSTSLTGLLLGYALSEAPQHAVACGADVVLTADHPDLQLYGTDAYTRVVTAMVLDGKPDILLLGATPNGRDLAGRLAVRLRTGLTADCTGLGIDPERRLLRGEVVGFGGGIVATILCPEHRPQMATVRPGIFSRPEPHPDRQGVVRSFHADRAAGDARVRVLERSVGKGVDLTRARALVAVGRGARGDLALAERLAALLDAEIAGTRVAADLGWIARARQIGQTGVVAAPRIAICCGISGAIHFTVGVDKAECVVAINTDPDAPIFEHADYCVIDDMFAVLPYLVEELAKAGALAG
jgi:electron transfer flavoprotein alpha subunit